MTSTVSTSAPVMVTEPAAAETLRVSGFSASTLRVLVSSSCEGMFCRSNGLFAGKPALSVKKSTAPIHRQTSARATARRVMTTGLFIFVFLVYRVTHAC